MSSRLDHELSKLDPAILFRAVAHHKHHTWAKTFHSRPELYIHPQSLSEIQKIITLARRCRRRIVVVGCGHSPSDLTCSSSWMVNLDKYDRVLSVDKQRRTMLVEAGIRLRDLNLRAKEHGLTMRNLGSIDQQSIAGAIATATHGSSLYHGLMSQSVRSLKIVLANGNAVLCSAEQNQELFRAALVSLGAIGIIVEVEFEMVPETNISWTQTLVPLQDILDQWSTNLWTKHEFTRVWWLPYTSRAIVWTADKTSGPSREPVSNWYGGNVGFHTYHILLWLANYVPPLLPWIERFVFGMQYGFRLYTSTSGIEEQRTGLLMNCLYSQFVNEWALPLSKGPEAITRLSAWIRNGDQQTSGIPFSARGLYVHCPIEVRISDTSSSSSTPRPYLDNTCPTEPTLYLNATLYRPYGRDPPCYRRYYQAFEHLMQEMGARPHWAKNFHTPAADDFERMYADNDNLDTWRRVRASVDPDGMFVGDWHLRTVLGSAMLDSGLTEKATGDARSPASSSSSSSSSKEGELPYAEQHVRSTPLRDGTDGVLWTGRVGGQRRGAEYGDAGWTGVLRKGSRRSSEESFEQVHAAEAEASMLLARDVAVEVEGEDEDEGGDGNTHWQMHGSAGKIFGGVAPFSKM